MNADLGERLLNAAKNGDEAEVRTLLELGAEPDVRDPEQEWTPLMRALKADHLAVAEQLLTAGADVNAAADTGTTVLIVAAGSGHTEIVRRLLDAGADPNARDMHGKSALDIVDVLIRFNPQLAPTRELLTGAGAR